jgi:hypothetical protein
LPDRAGAPYASVVNRWNTVLALQDDGKAALAEFERTQQKAAPLITRQPDKPKDVFDVLSFPPKVHPEHIPAPAKPKTGRWITAVLYGDTHAGFHDPKALSVVLGIIQAVQPDVVVNMGDLMDAYPISRFDKDPHRLASLQDEIDFAAGHLQVVAQVAPNARRVLLEGNHEDRLRKAIWNLDGAAAAFSRLNKFRETMTWPSLLDTATIGWEYFPAKGQAHHRLLPKFIVKHGTVVRKRSGYTAHAELERYNKSGASGHSHRLSQVWHRDDDGNHVWLETGCTCDTNPPYVEDPDWQQGCHVVTFDTETGAPCIETAYIHNGNAVWRGQTYEAAA